MQDLTGRPYVKVKELTPGLKLQCDGDFTCLRRNEIRSVHLDKEAPEAYYIRCQEGRHYLGGQLMTDKTTGEDYLIGLYLA